MKAFIIIFLACLLGIKLAFAGDFLGPMVMSPTGAVSGTGVTTSLPMDIRSFKAYSIQAEWSGTPVGTFAVQGSLDYNLPGVTTPTWTTLSGVTLIAPSGSSSSAIADVGNTGIPWVHVVYTNSSGTGGLEILGHAKGH